MVSSCCGSGDPLGQKLLGDMYRHGRGVPQVFISAHMWFNLAAARASGTLRDLAINCRNEVEAKMTPAEIAEAQRMAHEWASGFQRA